MPGSGRSADPLWFAIGFVVGLAPGLYFHQFAVGAGVGLVLGGACGLIREDIRKGYRRPASFLWFLIGLAIGLSGSFWLHSAGLSWRLSLGLGLALGLVFGSTLGTWRADARQEQDHENRRCH
jgi:hypothetical protein